MLTILADSTQQFQQEGAKFISWLKWGALVSAVVALIVCGLMMVLGRRHHNYYAQNALSGVAWVTLGLVIAASSMQIVDITMNNDGEANHNDGPGVIQVVDGIPGQDSQTTAPTTTPPPPTTPPPTGDPSVLVVFPGG